MHRSKILGGLALASLMLVVLTGCPSIISGVVAPGESVNKAVEEADEGDTVKVQGTVEEDVTVDKSDVTITGGEDGATIDGDTEVSGDSVSIENVDITGDTEVNGDDVTVKNTTIKGNLETATFGSFQGLSLDNATVYGETVSKTVDCADVVNQGDSFPSFPHPQGHDPICVATKDVLKASTGTSAAGLASAASATEKVVAQSNHCDATVSSGDSIQTAIGNASAGDTVCVESGTFNEQLNIGKSLILDGVGDTTSGTVVEGTGGGTGLTIDASDVTVKNLRIANFTEGIELDSAMSNLTFENVAAVQNGSRGMEWHNDADITNLTLKSVNFSNNDGDGIRGATTSKIDGLTIRDSHFDDNGTPGGGADSGIEAYQSESTPGYLKNVLIENTTFNNNQEKGLYLEKLSDATFDNVTIDSSGTDPNYGFNNGIDLNLKYDSYQNITIKNSTITNSGLDSTGAPNDLFPVAIAIKARDVSYSPASLDGVTISNVAVTNNFSAIRLGEPGKGNASPTNVEIHSSDLSNNTQYGVINVTKARVSATDNWWGDSSGPSGEGPGSGDAVSKKVDFDPWLVTIAD